MEDNRNTELEEIRALVEETRKIAKENNKILRQIRRDALLGFVSRIVFWLLILGVPLFFLSPYIGPLVDMFTATSTPTTVPSGMFGLPSGEQIQELLDAYKEIQGQ